MKRSTLIASLVVAVAALALLIFGMHMSSERQIAASIRSFEDCSKAGYPILETYPEQCKAPDGRTFTHIVEPPLPATTTPVVQATTTPAHASSTATSTASGGTHATTSPSNATSTLPACKPSGCSGEVCSDSNAVSNCIYSPVFACYKQPFARCERQSDGQCGWTPTSELKACIINGGPS